MQLIIELISQEQNKLAQSNLCQWLSEGNNQKEDKLLFIPSMTFFVLGFRDILNFIKIENPQTTLDFLINNHCDEDMDHWRWFLSDLEQLGFSLNSWGDNINHVFQSVWADENFRTRAMIYETIALIRSKNSPELSLVMIEVLEAAFGIFINSINPLIKESNLYHELTYFGKHHQDQEESHSAGSWTGDSKPDEIIENIQLSPQQREEAKEIVTNFFNRFHGLFDCWYEARNHYTRTTQKDSNIIHKELNQEMELNITN